MKYSDEEIKKFKFWMRVLGIAMISILLLTIACVVVFIFSN